VDHAITVSRSLARAAHDRYDLTLDQAAAVAEFDDDEETVKALVAAAKTARFDHVLATARQRRADAKARAVFTARIAAFGVRVIDEPEFRSPLRRLQVLTTPKDEPITETSHAGCGGHVAWADQEHVNVTPDGTVLDEDDESITDEQWEASTSELRWVAVYGCDNPTLTGPVLGQVRLAQLITEPVELVDPVRFGAQQLVGQPRGERRLFSTP